MGKDLKGKELGIGIYQRKDKRFSARYTDKRGKRLQFYDNNLTIVKNWLINVKYEDEHGLLGDASTLTVNKWFETWIDNYKKNVVSDSTVKNYKSAYYNHIGNEIGKLLLKNIKPIHLQQILNKMYDDGYSYGTMNQTKITMHAIFKEAINNEIVIKNPASNLKCKQREVEERRVLTVKEQEEFHKYSSKSMYYNAYALCLQTGLRSGEISGLKWNDIDWDRKIIKINRTLLFNAKEKGGFYFGIPKSKAGSREIPLSEEALDLLKQQKIEQFKLRSKSKEWEPNPLYENLVFTTINGKPTGHSTYNLNIARIVTNINNDRRAIANLNNTVFEEFKPMFMHALRHTFATRSIENGMKPKVLQVILGHSSLNITMDLYVHVTDEIKHDEIQKISKQFKVM